MTTLALIADIHGNLVALRSVLDALDRRGVDEIICLGDVAATGPQPRECLDLLAARNIPSVSGNADEWLLAPTFTPDADAFHRQVEEIDAWCAEQLTADQWAYLRTFEPTIAIDAPTPLLCFHGSPRSHSEVIDATTPLETLAELFAPHEQTLLAGGHTHQQLMRRVHDRILINPGSVGLGYEIRRDGTPRNVPWGEYALLRWENGAFSLSFHRAPFDPEAVRSAILRSGMPHAERWAADW